MWKSKGFVFLLGEEIEVIVTDMVAPGHFGECQKDERQVWIQPHLTDEQYKKTLIHELGHMLLYLTVHDDDGVELGEETFCRLIEHFADYLEPI